MSELGKHIIIEGADGVGKSTVMHGLAEIARKEHGVEVVTIEEPDSAFDTNGEELVPIASELRRIIKTKAFGRSALTNVLLFNSSRRENWFQAAEPALDRGAWVLQARNYLSTIAYQGYGEGWDIAEIENLVLNATSAQYMNPDHTYILDVDEIERSKRLAKRAGRIDLDTFESRPPAFQIAVGNAYRQMAQDRNLELISAKPEADVVISDIWNRITRS